jgi:hypothetical protein
MHFLFSVITDKPGMATEEEMAAIDTFNDGLRANGHWILAAGLQAPSDATVVDNRSGKALFTDGPFAETKEYVAGLWLIEAPDGETAMQLAAEGSKACNRKVEVRAFL